MSVQFLSAPIFSGLVSSDFSSEGDGFLMKFPYHHSDLPTLTKRVQLSKRVNTSLVLAKS